MHIKETNHSDIRTMRGSSDYKLYPDLANHYMNLYTTYCETHKDQCADLYSNDKHPKYYQQKKMEFVNKNDRHN